MQARNVSIIFLPHVPFSATFGQTLCHIITKTKISPNFPNSSMANWLLTAHYARKELLETFL